MKALFLCHSKLHQQIDEHHRNHDEFFLLAKKSNNEQILDDDSRLLRKYIQILQDVCPVQLR